MIVIDYFFLNVVKEMYVGYLCLIIIGDVVVCIFEFLGNKVICVNYVGDWGI